MLLTIAYLGFISLGFPDPVAGVAWPSVRDTFSLSQSSFGLVFIALGCGYCASGFFGGKLTQLLGLGNLLWISSGLVAVAMLGSSVAPAWPVFVICAVIWGLGSGGIDAGLNSYLSNHFSARHMNWLHACYSIGATLGPLLMTATLVRAGSWRLGYALVGGVLLLMTVLFLITRQRWTEPPRSVDGDIRPPVSMQATLRQPLVWLQIVLFFLYVGLEFTVGQWSFTVLTESRGLRPELAGMLAGAYYGAIGVGRVLTGVISQCVGLDRILRISMFIAVIGASAFAFAPAGTGDVALVVIGLGLAPVFPCLMSRTPDRLGAEYAAHAVGFQVSSGMLGGALVPGLTGLIAEQLGLEFAAQFAVLLAALLWGTHELLLVATSRHRGTVAKLSH
ncbi:MAG: exuT [Planctomycetaceae bacterium]|nr:exuT [Planctomycetaceae bacterium]